MGTRADFYVGRGEKAEWLGSIAWDGGPDNILPALQIEFGETVNEDTWRKSVAEFLKSREDRTLPEEGWPWPWDDSNTTDFAYAWGGEIFINGFGHGWETWKQYAERREAESAWEEYDNQVVAAEKNHKPKPRLPTMPRPNSADYERKSVFPDMKSRMKVKLGGPASGLIFVTAKKEDGKTKFEVN